MLDFTVEMNQAGNYYGLTFLPGLSFTFYYFFFRHASVTVLVMKSVIDCFLCFN